MMKHRMTMATKFLIIFHFSVKKSFGYVFEYYYEKLFTTQLCSFYSEKNQLTKLIMKIINKFDLKI